jgi:hypothetical protein
VVACEGERAGEDPHRRHRGGGWRGQTGGAAGDPDSGLVRRKVVADELGLAQWDVAHLVVAEVAPESRPVVAALRRVKWYAAGPWSGSPAETPTPLYWN